MVVAWLTIVKIQENQQKTPLLTVPSRTRLEDVVLSEVVSPGGSTLSYRVREADIRGTLVSSPVHVVDILRCFLVTRGFGFHTCGGSG